MGNIVELLILKFDSKNNKGIGFDRNCHKLINFHGSNLKPLNACFSFITVSVPEVWPRDLFEINETNLISKRDCTKSDCIFRHQKKPTFSAYMMFSSNPKHRTYTKTIGFTDWYGYVDVPCILRIPHDTIVEVNLILKSDNLSKKEEPFFQVLSEFFQERVIKNEALLYDFLEKMNAAETEYSLKMPIKDDNNKETEQASSDESTESEYFSLESMKSVIEEFGILFKINDDTLLIFSFLNGDLIDVKHETSEYNELEPGKGISFIEQYKLNGIIYPQPGSLKMCSSSEDPAINDALNLVTLITFSPIKCHKTYNKNVGFSNVFGFIEISIDSANEVHHNSFYKANISVKNTKNYRKPYFKTEGLLTKTIVSERYSYETLEQMKIYENTEIDIARTNMGSPSFSVIPEDPEPLCKNFKRQIYGKNKKKIKSEYCEMLVTDLCSSVESYGTVFTKYGDALLLKKKNNNGEELKFGTWFMGAFELNRSTEKLEVNRFDSIIPSLAEIEKRDNEILVKCEIERVKFDQNLQSYLIINHEILGGIKIPSCFCLKLQKNSFRVEGECRKVKSYFGTLENKTKVLISWELSNILNVIPDGIPYEQFKKERINELPKVEERSNVDFINNYPPSKKSEVFDDVQKIETEKLGLIALQFSNNIFIIYSNKLRKSVVLYISSIPKCSVKLGDFVTFQFKKLENPVYDCEYEVVNMIKLADESLRSNVESRVINGYVEFMALVDMTESISTEANSIFYHSRDLGQVVYEVETSKMKETDLGFIKYITKLTHQNQADAMACWCRYVNGCHNQKNPIRTYYWEITIIEGTVESYLEEHERQKMKIPILTKHIDDEDDVAQIKKNMYKQNDEINDCFSGIDKNLTPSKSSKKTENDISFSKQQQDYKKVCELEKEVFELKSDLKETLALLRKFKVNKSIRTAVKKEDTELYEGLEHILSKHQKR